MLGLTLRMHLQEQPVDLPAEHREHARVELAEAVEHPRLLIVCEVLDRQVVPQRIRRLLHRARAGRGAPASSRDVRRHGGPHRLRRRRRRVGQHERLERVPKQRCKKVGEELAVRLGLRVAVVHAVLAGERLDQVLERHVAAHIVRHADRALHRQQARGERRVERLQVVAQLTEHRRQDRLPAVSWQALEVGIEAPQGSDGSTLVQLSLQRLNLLLADQLR
mmetsp:Transcript_19353/g.57402  ORF Transcript_19353/g.57402 Transcript_19353/m.57402 type:complete len:221 (-) Transcript_19353:152-814(-)